MQSPSVSHRKSAGQPQPLGDVLARFLDRTGLAPKLEAASVIPDWAELVGPQIAAVTEPVRVSDGMLLVAVDTSAWMMELNMMKGALLRYVNAGRGAGRIREIRFVMAAGEGGA